MARRRVSPPTIYAEHDILQSQRLLAYLRYICTFGAKRSWKSVERMRYIDFGPSGISRKMNALYLATLPWTPTSFVWCIHGILWYSEILIVLKAAAKFVVPKHPSFVTATHLFMTATSSLCAEWPLFAPVTCLKQLLVEFFSVCSI
jgi:hypothetical protein